MSTWVVAIGGFFLATLVAYAALDAGARETERKNRQFKKDKRADDMQDAYDREAGE